MNVEIIALCIIQLIIWSFLTMCCCISRTIKDIDEKDEPLPLYTIDSPPNYDIINPPPHYSNS
jgi:hypothetical protein